MIPTPLPPELHHDGKMPRTQLNDSGDAILKRNAAINQILNDSKSAGYRFSWNMKPKAREYIKGRPFEIVERDGKKVKKYKFMRNPNVPDSATPNELVTADTELFLWYNTKVWPAIVTRAQQELFGACSAQDYQAMLDEYIGSEEWSMRPHAVRDIPPKFEKLCLEVVAALLNIVPDEIPLPKPEELDRETVNPLKYLEHGLAQMNSEMDTARVQVTSKDIKVRLGSNG